MKASEQHLRRCSQVRVACTGKWCHESGVAVGQAKPHHSAWSGRRPCSGTAAPAGGPTTPPAAVFGMRMRQSNHATNTQPQHAVRYCGSACSDRQADGLVISTVDAEVRLVECLRVELTNMQVLVLLMTEQRHQCWLVCKLTHGHRAQGYTSKSGSELELGFRVRLRVRVAPCAGPATSSRRGRCRRRCRCCTLCWRWRGRPRSGARRRASCCTGARGMGFGPGSGSMSERG